MNYKYGKFSESQIEGAKNNIRKRIYFLLFCVDKNTNKEFQNVDVNVAMTNLLVELGGMNDLFVDSPELVRIMSLLQAAVNEYNKEDFSFSVYRKLILDAASEVSCIGGV